MFLGPFVQKSRTVAHLALTRAFLQPAATATIHCQPEGCTQPPPPIPPFLLVQNVSSKWIAPTDNMQPKSDVTKKRHRLNGWDSYCKASYCFLGDMLKKTSFQGSTLSDHHMAMGFVPFELLIHSTVTQNQIVSCIKTRNVQ